MSITGEASSLERDSADYNCEPTGLLALVELPPWTWLDHVSFWLTTHDRLLRFVLLTVAAYTLLRLAGAP